MHRAALPPPGGERELLEWLGDYWSQRLDRGRPLWEIVLLEGLENGRWALATKTHHCMVDGVGSVDAAPLLLDSERHPGPPARPLEPGPERGHERHGLLRAVPAALAGPARAAADVARHPRQALERSAALADVLLRDEVVPAPKTSINIPIGTRRRFDVVRADLDELKEVKRELGGLGQRRGAGGHCRRAAPSRC